jgi:hypothetical protein
MSSSLCFADNQERNCSILTALIASALACSWVSSGVAQIIGFMPGDAYFRVQLSQEVVESLPAAGGNISLRYAATPALSGYAGFFRIKIEGVSEMQVQNIRTAYRTFRLRLPQKVQSESKNSSLPAPAFGRGVREDPHGMNDLPISELDASIRATNGVDLFIYNRHVDWTRQRIALKYNPNWSHLPASAFAGAEEMMQPTEGFFGEISRRAEVSQPLIKSYDAVVEDWKGAGRFKNLIVDVPKGVPWGAISDEPTTLPVVAKAKEIQFLVTRGGLDRYFRLESDTKCYRIIGDEITQMTWHHTVKGARLATEAIERDRHQ